MRGTCRPKCPDHSRERSRRRSFLAHWRENSTAELLAEVDRLELVSRDTAERAKLLRELVRTPTLAQAQGEQDTERSDHSLHVII